MTLTWRGPEVQAELRRRADRASRTGAEHLLDASNAVVPDDPTDSPIGDLKRSGKVTSERTPRGAESAVSYDTDYAVLQHEVRYYDHRPGQHAKFLEGAMASERAAIREKVRREMRI